MSLFDELVDRAGTASSKWCGLPGEDVTPLCMADMEFRAPAVVTAALRERVEHGVFGYTGYSEDFHRLITGWLARRYGWEAPARWISGSTGVVGALAAAVRAFTREGDGVIIQTPVYPPFYSVVTQNNRRLLENPLALEGGVYRMDYALLAEQLKEAKLLILCHPHNPVGRVWTPEELRELGELCLAHTVPVISDDIHADITLSQPYHPYATLDDTFARHSVTCLSPSKTFNIAGLNTSYEVVPNPEMLAALRREKRRSGLWHPNLFGLTALEAAYRDGDAWLDALRDYLRDNLAELRAWCAGRPGVQLIEPEGTYLAWLDMRSLGESSDALTARLLHDARVRLMSGRAFGPTGEGFLRMNYALPRSALRACLERMAGVLGSG